MRLQVIRGSPFAVSSPTRRTATAPSTAADSMQASSIDTIGGRSPIAPASHERPIESTLNAVRETMESHRMEPFRLWTVELPLEWHVLAIDVILRVVEASMIAALNDSSAAASSDVLGTSGGDRGSLGGRGLSWSGGGGSSSVDSRGVSNGVSGSHGANGVTGDAGEVGAEADDMYRGNETLAAFTLHHCMHVSLQGYALLNPFKCGAPDSGILSLYCLSSAFRAPEPPHRGGCCPARRYLPRLRVALLCCAIHSPCSEAASAPEHLQSSTHESSRL